MIVEVGAATWPRFLEAARALNVQTESWTQGSLALLELGTAAKAARLDVPSEYAELRQHLSAIVLLTEEIRDAQGRYELMASLLEHMMFVGALGETFEDVERWAGLG